MHPVLTVRRDRRGRLLSVTGEPTAGGEAESWQLYEVDRELDPLRLAQLERRLRQTLEDVTAAVKDWQPMREVAAKLAATLGKQHPAGLTEEVNEARALLGWMAEDRFTFLGYRYQRLERGRNVDRLAADTETGLGVLRERTGNRTGNRTGGDDAGPANRARRATERTERGIGLPPEGAGPQGPLMAEYPTAAPKPLSGGPRVGQSRRVCQDSSTQSTGTTDTR